MKYVTHNTSRSPIDWMGSSLAGYVTVSYADLVRVLGEPMGPSGDGKVKAEWIIKFRDGKVATIYDYKSDLDPVNHTAWHIGGRSDGVVERVGQLLKDAGVHSGDSACSSRRLNYPRSSISAFRSTPR